MATDRYSFLLRMWRERRSGSTPGMRGSLQRVDSDRVQYFESLERLVEILQDATGSVATEMTGHTEEQGEEE